MNSEKKTAGTISKQPLTSGCSKQDKKNMETVNFNESLYERISLLIVKFFFSSSLKSVSISLLFGLPKYQRVPVKSFPI